MAIDQMALGHLRIDPWEWARWTLKEFDLAYEGWAKINVHERWEQTRVLSYYSLVSQGAKISSWKDVFHLTWDKKIKKKSLSKIAPMTEKEKEEFEFIIKNAKPLNGK